MFSDKIIPATDEEISQDFRLDKRASLDSKPSKLQIDKVFNAFNSTTPNLKDQLGNPPLNIQVF